MTDTPNSLKKDTFQPKYDAKGMIWDDALENTASQIEDTNLPTEQYFQALRLWCIAKARLNFLQKQKNSSLEKEAAKKLAVAREHLMKLSYELKNNHGYQVPIPEAPISVLARVCVRFAYRDVQRPNGQTSLAKYKFICDFADIKFGKGALLQEFSRQIEDESDSLAANKWINMDSDKITPKRKLKMTLLMVAGLTVLSIGIFATVVTFGAASPLAFLTTKVGIALIVAGAVGFGAGATLSYRDSYRQYKRNQLEFKRTFCETENGQKLHQLPEVLPTRALKKS